MRSRLQAKIFTRNLEIFADISTRNRESNDQFESFRAAVRRQERPAAARAGT
ncbi:acyltransferase family domain protein [Burkholderia thailandensis]|uniref:Acyltransferase family domain protein n=1 Tax=Burkholderia thailandensis TaxID=57975 RepID=A0AAW9CPI2_BURTH|nr:acyltransferase family domain protein [Burkholderia thailandensis]MDW9251506.1 acyltransferase family domain protein [Burkholderia thailandensis]